DREAYLADPDFVDVPIDGLLSKHYARERARLIDSRKAAERVAPGQPSGSRRTAERPGRTTPLAPAPPPRPAPCPRPRPPAPRRAGCCWPGARHYPEQRPALLAS